ncbi:FAD-dependent oxidoreductase [Parapedobacter sp. 10938]|uniref:FAD-dependent oxidoreductase n=1 Tax=Parapedobacter flavus TaxID=3110225 RepID=UPI002DB69D9E|nr:FAD-dependent oxidoreductase [Parapedobacter sp. 10938]MEC3879408.1 FAD-dependent oxidoreductase [Parapedobacter sp. 10938]
MIPFLGNAQRKRPQVLVYGYGADAYAAAVQSAMSNLNTVWVVNGDRIMPELTSEFISLTNNAHLDAGIWANLLAGTKKEKPSDSLLAVVKRRINPQLVQNAVDSILKSFSNLTVIEGSTLRSVKKSGKNWRVELDDRSRFKIRAVVDASTDAQLYRMAYATVDSFRVRKDIPADYFQSVPYRGLARTGVAVGERDGHGYTLPLGALVPAGEENLFLTRYIPAVQQLTTGAETDIPLLMHVGQAVGAAAAYTAFFKTTPDKLDARSVQGELLQYGARLMPFVDVPLENPHFDAIQRVGATGLLLGKVGEDGQLHFHGEAAVTANEVQPVLNDLFSRSQIWFINHGDVDTLTMADLFSYIKFVGQRGDELEEQVEKYWKRRYHFEGEYDEKQQATRAHVAVLLDAYCDPFDVKVGLDGSIQR